jgi:hypothetical protein
MSTEAAQSHTLAGFPAAAVEFVTVMQRNRERIGQVAGLSPASFVRCSGSLPKSASRPSNSPAT